MKIIVSGALGHMGREVLALAAEGVRGAEAVGGIDPMYGGGDAPVPCVRSFEEAFSHPAYGDAFRSADCVVDFSRHDAVGALLEFARRTGMPAVIATTGHTDEENALIREAAGEIPVFLAANMSLGIALLIELAKQAAAAMPEAEIEIIEKHHDRKLDAPSGTALKIADAIREVRPEAYPVTGRSGYRKRTADEIGIHAVRMGNIVGEHEVIIGTPNQTVTLKHEAHSRALFAEGALAAASFLIGKPAGLYGMNDLVANGKNGK